MLKTLKFAESACIALAIVLTAVALLAVPTQSVFGDDPMDCDMMCQAYGPPGSANYLACMQTLCASQAQGCKKGFCESGFDDGNRCNFWMATECMKGTCDTVRPGCSPACKCRLVDDGNSNVPCWCY